MSETPTLPADLPVEKQPKGDELVRRVVCYNEKPLWLHGYILAFIPLYAIWLYCLIAIPFPLAPPPTNATLANVSDVVGNVTLSEHNATALASAAETDGTWIHWSFELAMILLAGIGLLQILTVLACVWSVNIRAALTCVKENDPQRATVAQVIPQPNNGSAELVRLYRQRKEPTDMTSELTICFIFQKVKFILTPSELQSASLDSPTKGFRRPTFPIHDKFAVYRDAKGHTDEAAVLSERLFGKNRLEMYAPNFRELFQERATAPFFVFQVFCVGLWCLDEYWYYSVFTLFMLVAFEATLVQQQLRNLAEIRKMGHKPYPLQVYRNRRWRQSSSDELLPGDIVSIVRRPEEGRPVPADMLLIRGTCIVDESLLTGESVPQMKESIESFDSAEHLDIGVHGRLHVLFGGTKVVQHAGPAKGEKDTSGLRAPDNGCICYVLRTGFNTSQGSLLRTIMFGVKRVTANNKETFGFILFLLTFALSAAGYLWIEGSKDERRSKYKLFLECTLILTSVIPPELPIELSLAVNSSLLALVKLGTYCTEPFRIPFAGKIDVCCFDKTGTLTSDTLVVQGVSGIPREISGGSAHSEDDIVSADSVPWETLQVLAACHSLVLLDDTPIGDPLEKVTLDAVKWNITKADAVVPTKGKQPALKIYQRFHFSSALKRMSVIGGFAKATGVDTEFFGAVKGAPEVLRSMFASVPDGYDEMYLKHTRQGARVLALGRKSLGQMALSNIRNFHREDIEADLSFVGFLIIDTPLRPESKPVVQELLFASHHITMITGDNALTACHVGAELGLCGNNALVFDGPSSDLHWESVNGQERHPLDAVVAKKAPSMDLCLTGPGLEWMVRSHYKNLTRVLPMVKVFARFTPNQKEWVVNELKQMGFFTLMCGDGTNDVGALKHSHVGVALLQKAVVSAEKLKANYAEGSGETLVPLMPPGGALQTTAGKSGAAAGASKAEGETRGPRNRRLQEPPARTPPTANRANLQQQRLQQLIEELQDDQEVTVVKLGDASVAAPFSSKIGSVRSVCDIVKQGRCTLVTTLQMFKILALNALILAYSQSVLYLKGVKFSDTQATIQGLFLAGCFLFISRSKPLTVLSAQRPLPNIFNAYTLLTVCGQFAVHFGCLVFLVTQTLAQHYSLPDKLDLEAEFAPNLLNTVVYLMSMTLQVSTFLVNYRGRPFMESLLENRPLMYSISISLSSLFAMASNVFPAELQEQLQIVRIPDEFVYKVVGALALDIVAAWCIDRVLLMLFGEGTLKRRK
ncbi:endoplasmic reticulum transmembrane helix translocase-like isoform X2 [Paramacrobiotus metropolitanus]|uniref:endoplasmic reticulum transmembrane helix translocase-like isoform X2 n=1 Tax=Paramacrobiotus metropolitanus TaxID=2943436 RepID=UPI00244620F3|nr:endoplasmic reticulum transmembrane helix translocase-like isoform X2 [Paramacrobiotus metropolitanus]